VGSGGWGVDEWNELEERCQPTAACAQMGGLAVTPRKGDGLFWYNVKPEAFAALQRGGPLPPDFGDRALVYGSLHCGAEVLEGEKWLANLWFRLSGPGAGGGPGAEL